MGFEGHTGQIRLWGIRVLWASPGAEGTLTPGKGIMSRGLEHPPTTLPPGHLGVSPKALSSLQHHLMGLKDPLPGVPGPLARGHPPSDLPSSQLRGNGELEAAVSLMLGRGGHLRTQGQGQSKGTSPQGPSRKWKQSTVKPYLSLKFKMAGWKVGCAAHRERASASFTPRCL